MLFAFDDFDLFLRQSIQFIKEPVDLVVGGVNLALENDIIMVWFDSADFLCLHLLRKCTTINKNLMIIGRNSE